MKKMALTKEQIKKIEDTIRKSLRNKFLTYKPETSNMPFHYRLLGRDRMALFSFIHSLNTTFGTSIFEPVAETVATLGKINRLRTLKVDLFVKSDDGSIHLFDIKTAKPNISNFKDFKRTLLEWIAIYLSKHSDANIHSYIAIPYNPYEPKPYERWTLKGMLDLDNELKVAEEFWVFLGGEGCYFELLDCFERVGIELRPEIDKYFSKFK